jgi:hypothetical protein
MADTNLNAAQLQNIAKVAELNITRYIADTQLRKWAVEQALAAFGEGKATPTEPLMVVAKAIYDFTVQPLKLDITP